MAKATKKSTNVSAIMIGNISTAAWAYDQSGIELAALVRKAGPAQKTVRDACVNAWAARRLFPQMQDADAAISRAVAANKDKPSDAVKAAFAAARKRWSRFLSDNGLTTTEARGGARKPRPGTVKPDGVTTVAGTTAPASVLLKAGETAPATPVTLAIGDIETAFRESGARLAALCNANAKLGGIAIWQRAAIAINKAIAEASAELAKEFAPAAPAKPRKSRGK